jgi:zinc-ribbon domain
LTKSQRFENQNMDLIRLSNRIVSYLQSEKFEVGFSKDQSEPASWFLIQARKVGALRTITGARRSTDITIRGEPNSFEVSIGNGEWGTNVIATSVPTILTGGGYLLVQMGLLYTNKSFEDNLWKYVRDQVGFLEGTSNTNQRNAYNIEPQEFKQQQQTYDTSNKFNVQQTQNSFDSSIDVKRYVCDYVEGYPGWDSPIENGQILLERNTNGKDRIIFRSPDTNAKEIIIPAEDIAGANIITRHEGDLMIELQYNNQTTGNNLIKPVFNFNDFVIRGVLAGINELIAEETELKNIQGIKMMTTTKFCMNCGFKLPTESKFCSSCGTKQ